MSSVSIVLILIAFACGLLILWRIPLVRSVSWKAMPVKKVSLVIPAYNEEKRLPELLMSLQKQDYQPHQVLVVDDHSSDRTAAVAATYDVTVIESLELTEGWIGKSRACWSGARAATGELILFLDADVAFTDENSLRRLLVEFEQSGAVGILSVQPYHDVRKLYESLSAIFNVIVMAGMNVFTPLRNKIKGAGSFGPCILCDRESYFAVGGHESIKGAIMDDLELGRAFQDHGRSVRCYGGRTLIQFRMYPDGLANLVEGWTKSFGTASQSTHPLVFAMIIAWVSGGFSSTFLLLRQLLAGDSLVMKLISLLLALAYSLLLIWQGRRVGRFHLVSLLLYPIHFTFFAVLFIWSLIKTKLFHSVSWRGRKIDV